MKKHLIFSILLMNVSLIHAEGVQLTCQLYYPACPSCIENQWLLPFEKFSNSADTIEIEADKSEVIDKDNYLITGNVNLRNDSHFLSADKVIISKTKHSLESLPVPKHLETISHVVIMPSTPSSLITTRDPILSSLILAAALVMLAV